MSTADYITRGVQTLTTNLGLTKVTQNLFDPTVDAVNSNASILDAAALIVAAPALATSAGKAGQIAFDATHFYVCVALNTWVRATLATF
jgi:ABC-type proline/glycine betaine transport system permease subunit